MKLRPMLMSDADFMLSLKNDSDTRFFALLTSEEIKREDHIKFLEKNIQYFQVIQDGVMQRAGAIRIQDSEISIWLDPKFRGKGIALKTINTVKEKGMTAKIVFENFPSLRAFIRAGFLPVDLKEVPLGHYIFKYEGI